MTSRSHVMAETFPRGSYAFVDRYGQTLQLTERVEHDRFGPRIYALNVSNGYESLRPVWIDEIPRGEALDLAIELYHRHWLVTAAARAVRSRTP